MSDQDAATVLESYFAERFGQLREDVIAEIVPDDISIDIRICEAGNATTLWTHGMSDHAMAPPPGLQDFTFAELFIQMAPGWPVEALDDPDSAWPIQWLRDVAKFPIRQQTSLAGPAVVLANESAEHRIGATTAYCGMLLAADDTIQVGERLVKLYRMLPLHWDEIALERNQGLPVLLRRLDEEKVPFVVGNHRQSVA